MTITLPRGYKLFSYGAIDSTNAEAKRLEHCEDTIPVVWATSQTQGRGRYDRRWESPEGNFFCSLRITPDFPFGEAPQLSYVMALALHSAIGDKAQLKWPNDILIDGKKVGGILLESYQQDIILGAGVNISSYPDKNMRYPATCLKKEGVSLETGQLLSFLIDHFDRYYTQWQEEGFAAIQKEWMQACCHIDQEITVQLPSSSIAGICREIDAEGKLLLEVNGELQYISAGDVFINT